MSKRKLLPYLDEGRKEDSRGLYQDDWNQGVGVWNQNDDRNQGPGVVVVTGNIPLSVVMTGSKLLRVMRMTGTKVMEVVVTGDRKM